MIVTGSERERVEHQATNHALILAGLRTGRYRPRAAARMVLGAWPPPDVSGLVEPFLADCAVADVQLVAIMREAFDALLERGT